MNPRRGGGSRCIHERTRFFPLPLAGEGLFLHDSRDSKRFVRLSAPELLLLCLSKVEVTKRKRHPDGAPCAHPWAPGARAGSGVFRRHIHVPAKNWPASCRPSCGLSSTRPPRHRGPGKAARSRRALGRSRCAAARAQRGALLIRIAYGHARHAISVLTLELSRVAKQLRLE